MPNKTLLNCVNEVLKRTGKIAGDSGVLTTLTDSARQRWVDIAVQTVNEGMDELYAATNKSKPKERAEGSITLVTNQIDYTLATNLVQLNWPLSDRTNSQYIVEAPGGYDQLLINDLEQDDTGLPMYGAISPADSKLYLDRKPTSVENGRVYTYQYDKDISMSAAADTVPFTDAVFRAMVPAWAQLFRRDLQKEFDGEKFRADIGRASRLLIMRQQRSSYSPR